MRSWTEAGRAGAWVAALYLGILPSPGHAERPAVIPPIYAATAATQAIPPALFYAIALQESGRAMPGGDGFRPWPWSLNIAGDAHYYPTMEAAWDALQTHLHHTPGPIDIGLVQVSWPVNRHIIHDPYLALDPTINLAIGAQILKACYDRLDDWWAAVGCYHSPTPARAEAYQARVRRHWQRLVSRGAGGP